MTDDDARRQYPQPPMNAVEYVIELKTRQAGRQIAEDAAIYLEQVEEGIMGATDDAMTEIDRYLAIAAEMGNGA